MYYTNKLASLSPFIFLCRAASLTTASSRLSRCRACVQVSPSIMSRGHPTSLSRLMSGGGDLGRTIVTVVSTVSMATTPLHVRHHFVCHLVARPHVSAIAAETQTASISRRLLPTENLSDGSARELTPPHGCTVLPPSCRDDNPASRKSQRHLPPHSSLSLLPRMHTSSFTTQETQTHFYKLSLKPAT